tara:strand:- start:11637 stop:13193 length:1557 start_codon:yes stop_codon:yes gene_type:complete
MKTRKSILMTIMAVLFCLAMGSSQSSNTRIKIETKEDAPIISKHIYGHFAEHLGRCIYGGLYVGEDSAIPNTNGVRNDIIDALIDLKIPNLRWPGGCFADTYHWKDGVGPKENRPEMVNRWWGGVIEDNSFGTHDFLNLCEVLDAEPYLAANVGSSTVQEFTEYVEYVLHKGGSPMADYRQQNGREKPWDVKIWGVGNEMWGCGGNMTPEYYANIYRQYATFMTDWNNSDGIYRVASGASEDDYHWTEVLMRDIPKSLIEGVALHSYSVIDWDDKGPSVDFTEDHYFKTMKKALRMDELITKHVAIMDKYDPEKKIDLIVDEWGGWYNVEEGTNPGFLYQQNTMRDAMIAGTTLNIFNNHSDRVKMANLAQTVNVLQAVILTDEEKMLLTPTYHVMKMYNVHHDSKLLPVSFDSPMYTYGDDELAALSVSASQDQKGKVHISLTNIDPSNDLQVNIPISDLDVKKFTAQILASKNLQDHNEFDEPNKITPEEFKDFKVKKGTLEITIPAFSVIVFEGQ